MRESVSNEVRLNRAFLFLILAHLNHIEGNALIEKVLIVSAIAVIVGVVLSDIRGGGQ